MPHFAQFYKCALQVNPYCYSAYRGNSIKDEDEYNASILTSLDKGTQPFVVCNG